MFDLSALKDNFGKAAPVYAQYAHLQRMVREHSIALAKNYWRGNEHILDLGCGTGALSHEASLLKLKWNITSLDVSYGMCRMAAKQNSHTVNANAEAIPFVDECFDGIFSSLMLQWANTPEGVFMEMARTVKPSGVGVVSTLVQGTLHELEQAFKALDDKRHVSHFLKVQDVLAFAEQAGFTLELVKQTPYVEHHAHVIALMRSLQAIGATNKATGRPRGLMTPQKMARLERAYRDEYADTQGLPASWQVLYLILRKV